MKDLVVEIACMRLARAFIGIVVFLFSIPVVVRAQQPMLKVGSCPSGYHTSGNYCVPSRADAGVALQKSGACPSGYFTSGNYCVSTKGNTKDAIPKVGTCPSGYSTSGNYCVSTSPQCSRKR
jgi:hypothetical protein